MTIKERLKSITEELSEISISGVNFYNGDNTFYKFAKLATNAKNKIQNSEIIEGLAIALKVFIKTKALCSKIDTSSGMWESADHNAKEALELAINKVEDNNEQDYIFKELLKATAKKEIADWDGEYDLLKISAKLLNDKNHIEWQDKLCETIGLHSKEEFSIWGRYYEKMLMAEYYYNYLPNEYIDYLDKHLDINDIRKKRLEIAIEKQDYKIAEELCLLKYEEYNGGQDGIWVENLIDIYRKTNQTEKLVNVLQNILIKDILTRKINPYEEIKQIYLSQGVWEEKYKEILALTRIKNYKAYLSILYKEKEWELYLKEIESAPREIYNYGKILAKYYPLKVYELYRLAMLEDAEEASNRKHYYFIAKHIKEVIKFIGLAEAQAIKTELISLYPKRLAMKEELELAIQGKHSRAWDR